MIKNLMRTSAALGVAASALLTVAPAHAAPADTPRTASPAERNGTDELVDKTAVLALHTLVGEPNDEDDGLAGALLPRKENGAGLDVSNLK
ncbi:hypothetical protein ACQPZG_01055 (plasmid) [Streptomyces sp. CA-294286]|uniref:hypothetical protein n=1 Tax=Streptomyces sp. CA-294286 TaxID=3240070 RepID=UPI003D9208ED